MALKKGDESKETAELTQHNLNVVKRFRDAYFTFMDESSRLWQQQCRKQAELSSSMSSRSANLPRNAQPEEANSLAQEFERASREIAGSAAAELDKAMRRYEHGMAAAWGAAGERGVDESVLWHVGLAQVNVAWEYSVMRRSLGL